jgi:WD40 repeat protein
LHFSPSSMLIASASSDACIRLWSVLSDASVVTLTGYARTVSCCTEFSSDGALVAVGASDGSVRLWEVATGQLRAFLQCPQVAPITNITLSPDAKLLSASVGTTASCVSVFDVMSSSRIASPEPKDVEKMQCSVESIQAQKEQEHKGGGKRTRHA